MSEASSPVSLLKTVLPERFFDNLIVSIKPNDLIVLCKPGVYIFWRKQDALYIVSSRRLISRMSNPNHESARRAASECTRIEIHICKSELLARELEQHFITRFDPIYNISKRKSQS